MSALDAGDREAVLRALDEAAEEREAVLAAEMAREKNGFARNFPASYHAHPVRRFEVIERALERHGFVITRRT